MRSAWAPVRRGRRQGGPFGQAVGDLGGRAAADRLDAGQGPDFGQHGGGVTLRQGRERRGQAFVAAGGAPVDLAGAVELRAQAPRTGERPLQPRREHVAQADRIDEGAEQGDIAQQQGKVGSPPGGGGRPGQGGHAGVGFHRVGVVERLRPICRNSSLRSAPGGATRKACPS